MVGSCHIQLDREPQKGSDLPGSVCSGGCPKRKPGDLGNQEPGEGWGEENGVGGVGGVPGWVLYQRSQGRSCF